MKVAFQVCRFLLSNSTCAPKLRPTYDAASYNWPELLAELMHTPGWPRKPIDAAHVVDPNVGLPEEPPRWGGGGAGRVHKLKSVDPWRHERRLVSHEQLNT